jgi:dienelactone hydrolase
MRAAAMMRLAEPRGAPPSPPYHGPSAEDAWRRILRFFDAQLGDQAETR